MIVVIEEPVLNVDLIEDVVMELEVAEYNIPPGITADTLTEAGSLIVASAAGVPSETGAPNADGLVWTSKLDEPLKGSWQAVSGGGGDIELTNKSGTSQTAGTVVIWDADNDTAFTTTTNQRDRRVAGVLSEDISNNSAGKVAVAGKRTTVKVTGTVLRGMWLIASSTAGYAMADGYARPAGAIGIALTENPSGTGTVTALISVDHYLGASKGNGYIIGGSDGSASAIAQILTTATETVALSAGANLGAVRSSPAGASNGTDGYTFGGTSTTAYAGVQVTAYKTPISTNTTAGITSANLTSGRSSQAGMYAALAAYVLGGWDGAGTTTTTAFKMPWATSTTALQGSASLSSARSTTGSIYSSSAGYFAGGFSGGVQSAAFKLNIATEITAAIISANLSAAREGTTGIMDTITGYFCGGNTGSVSTTTDKMPFGTEVTAATGSAALSAARKKSAGASSTNGYILGGSTVNTTAQVTPGTPIATTDKLSFSTDVMAAAAGANLATSISSSSFFGG